MKEFIIPPYRVLIGTIEYDSGDRRMIRIFKDYDDGTHGFYLVCEYPIRGMLSTRTKSNEFFLLARINECTYLYVGYCIRIFNCDLNLFRFYIGADGLPYAEGKYGKKHKPRTYAYGILSSVVFIREGNCGIHGLRPVGNFQLKEIDGSEVK